MHSVDKMKLGMRVEILQFYDREKTWKEWRRNLLLAFASIVVPGFGLVPRQFVFENGSPLRRDEFAVFSRYHIYCVEIQHECTYTHATST
jgi:hypothetical protein